MWHKFDNVIFSEECSVQLATMESCIFEREAKEENLNLGQNIPQRSISGEVHVFVREVQPTLLFYRYNRTITTM